MEVDGVDEVLLVAEAARRVLHPPDLGVYRLAGRMGDPMPQIGDDVLEAPPEHARHLDHRLEAAAQGPVLQIRRTDGLAPNLHTLMHLLLLSHRASRT